MFPLALAIGGIASLAVSVGLIAANILVFLLVNFQSEEFVQAAVFGLGYIPSVVFDLAELPPNFVLVPEDTP